MRQETPIICVPESPALGIIKDPLRVQQSTDTISPQQIPSPGDEILIEIGLHPHQGGIHGAVIEKAGDTGGLAKLCSIVPTAAFIPKERWPLAIVNSTVDPIHAQPRI